MKEQLTNYIIAIIVTVSIIVIMTGGVLAPILSTEITAGHMTPMLASVVSIIPMIVPFGVIFVYGAMIKRK